MKKLHFILIAILAFQILIFLSGFLGGENLARFSSKEPLFSLSDHLIDKIELEAIGSKALLSLKDGKWVLPNLENFPVSEIKVNSLIDGIDALKREWPVGKTKEAQKQFKVSDSTFEKKISFYEKEKLIGTLFIGTSPSFKKVHMRTAGEEETYAIPFQSYIAVSNEKDWRDRDILKLNSSELSKVTINDFELARSGDSWKLADKEGGETLNPDRVNALISNLSNISFVDLLGKEYEAKKSALEFSVELGGKGLNYAFYGPIEKDYYLLKRSDLPFNFKVSKSIFDSLNDSERKNIIGE